MRLSREQTADNRRRILETAIGMFRRHGIERVGIAQLMRASGFTHGGFYNHFRSKDALVAEACRLSFARAEAAFAAALRGANPNAWRNFVAAYLALEHGGESDDGATIAALASDASRQGVELQRAFARTLESMTQTLGEFFSRSGAFTAGGSSALRAVALHRLSGLVGGWVLARAVSRANPNLAREILRANRRWLTTSETERRSRKGR